jgi:uncharacterized protein
VKKDAKTHAVLMDFNIAQLLKQPTGEAREYPLHEDLTGLDPALDPTEPLTGKVKLIRTKNGVLVTFSGMTTLQVACSRCLDPVSVPVDLSFEEEFFQTVDVVTGSSLPTPHDDPAVLINAHHEVHLAEVIREYLLTALPMHPLCREDCKGLCPQCGHNLNEGPCGHVAQATDDRWAALKPLLK